MEDTLNYSKNSTIYTLNNGFEYIEDLYHGFPYFQKNLDINNKFHQTELKIAQKLILSPQDNLVRVYDIEYSDPIHIKYELLDIHRDFPNSQELMKQLGNGLKNLHQMNCIYIDLKDDNIGYSLEDASWKIFDFDCSGICTGDFQHWIVTPPDVFIFREVISIVSNLDKFLIKNKIELKPEEKEKLKVIIKREDLGKYDDIACFLNFGKFLEIA